jgi:hypothetical protein
MTRVLLPAGGEIFLFAISLSQGLKWTKHEADLMLTCIEIIVQRNTETISAYIKFESSMAVRIVAVVFRWITMF